MTTRTGCTQTLLSSDYIFFFHQRNRVFDCLLFGQAALVFSEFIFNRIRPKKIFIRVLIRDGRGVCGAAGFRGLVLRVLRGDEVTASL